MANGTVTKPYTELINWLNDKNLDSEFPKNLNVEIFPPHFILMYMRGYENFPTINKLFNNYYMYKIPKIEMLKQLKEIIYKTKFKQLWIPKSVKQENESLYKFISDKLPWLKNEEKNQLCVIIQKDENLSDQIRDQFDSTRIKIKSTTRKKKQ